MRFTKLAVAIASIGSVFAQRPSSVSICDYYTTALLKQNTPANQYTLITLLVNAVVIGNYTQPNTGVALKGILAPAVYNGENVNLLPYFNGCLKSTNRGGHAVSVNFLDGGGAAPLMKNLPANDNTSNQYFLLTHLYQFIGKLAGCTGYGQPGFPAYQGNPSMYTVHRFMDLDVNELGLFIQQVGLAALSYGVSSADATAVGGALMTLFGYRCSPATAVTGPAVLQSICIDQSCPLDPKAQCAVYPYAGVAMEPQVAPQCQSSSSKGYYSSTKTYSSSKYEATKSYESKTSEYKTWETYSYKTSSSTKPYYTSSWDKSSSTKPYYTTSWDKSSSTKPYESSKTTESKYVSAYGWSAE